MSRTDTNQASEALDKKLGRLLREAMFIGETQTLASTGHVVDGREVYTIQALKNEMKHLIRTEKLKLLAEVRERVVGEDDYQPGNPAPDLVEHNRLVRDGLRFEQRTALNKLKAEL